MIGEQPEGVALARGTLGKERHVCAFFHNRDEEYRTMLPFICEGFARGEKAIHIVDPALRTEHLERLSGAGIDVQAALARKQLDVSVWADTYLPDGTFDREWTSAQVRGMLLRARGEGFPRSRVIGHGDWALDDPAHLAAIVPYEARMTDVLSEFDDPVVCTYDRSKFDGSTIVDLIRGHPIALVDGALTASPLFVPAAQLMFRLRGRTVSVLRDRFLVALLVGARREAFDILLDEALWRVPITSLYLCVVQAALYEVGRLWQQNRIGVAQEHTATEIARLALAQLRVHLPSEPSNGKHIVVACVEGELHDLGARVTADFLEMAGFEVQYLGANVPAATVATLVRERAPDLLALSATAAASATALRRTVAAVRAVAGGSVPIAVGGQVLVRRPHLARQLGATISARDAQEAVVLIRRVLGR